MTKMQKIIYGAFAILLVAAVICIVVYLGETELTTRENTLFNILLTMFSVIASVIVSHFYFDAANEHGIAEIKKDYEDNLRTYAHKAAEKVANLSNELTKLSIYLQEHDDDETEGDRDIILIKEERIKSAIHIIGTLKSVNDRSLSDWHGVIPEEEITEQNEMIEERENSFKELINEFNNIVIEPSERYTDDDHADNEEIRRDIQSLSQRLETLATSILGTPVAKIRKTNDKAKKVSVVSNCPECDTENKYRQRPLTSSIKEVTCSSCHTKLYSRWDIVGGYNLTTYAPEQEPLDEDMIQNVASHLPPQPWPKGTSTLVGAELGIRPAKMKRITDELIKRGVYKVQIDGVLYDPADTAKPVRAGRPKKAATPSPKISAL